MTDEAPVHFDKTKHDRSEFSCGEGSLDTWLKEQATQAAKKDATRTYVVADDQGKVIGYYSLCAYSVETEGAPPSMKVGRYPVPAVLLARLAVEQREQGTGLGALLLLHAYSVAVTVADAIGARMLVVHALHEQAARYYEVNGFKPFEKDPLTLYLPMQDVRESLRVAAEQE